MKRVYLTENLPENTKSASSRPDIQQKLESYKECKKDYANVPPAIRPYPLEKYQTNKADTILSPSDRNEEIEEAGEKKEQSPSIRKTQQLMTIIDQLPKHVRARAKRLVDHVSRVNTGDLDLRDLLYDLTVPNVKRIRSKNVDMLASVVRQLESDATLNKRLFLKKVGTSSASKNQHPSTTSHPTRSRALSWTPLTGRYYAGKTQQASSWL